MHVPARAVDRHEPAPGFTQPSSHQHLLSQGRGLELLEADRDVTRVVATNESRILARNVQGGRSGSEQQIDRLVVEPRCAADRRDLRVPAFPLVQRREQQTPVTEPVLGDVQRHVLQDRTLVARLERRVGRAKRSGPGPSPDPCQFLAILRIDLGRGQQAVARHSGTRTVGAGQPGKKRPHAETGLPLAGRIHATGQHLDVRLDVVGVAVVERPHDGHPLRVTGQTGKGAAEGDPGQRRRHFTGLAANFRWGPHHRIKGLDMAGSSGEVEEHDGDVLDERSLDGLGSLKRQHVSQRQPTDGAGADLQERSPRQSVVPFRVVVGKNGQHSPGSGSNKLSISGR